jgi:hypothetical protein
MLYPGRPQLEVGLPFEPKHGWLGGGGAVPEDRPSQNVTASQRETPLRAICYRIAPTLPVRACVGCLRLMEGILVKLIHNDFIQRTPARVALSAIT